MSFYCMNRGARWTFRCVYTVGVRREISLHLYSYLHTIESDTVIIVLLSEHFISTLINPQHRDAHGILIRGG